MIAAERGRRGCRTGPILPSISNPSLPRWNVSSADWTPSPPTSSLLMPPEPKKPSAWPFPPPSKPTVSLAAPASLRLFSRSPPSMSSDGSRPPAGSSPASRFWRKNYGRIPPSPSITSLPRPKWPSILRTAPASIRFTFAMSPRRISMSIPSMRFSSMPPTT